MDHAAGTCEEPAVRPIRVCGRRRRPLPEDGDDCDAAEDQTHRGAVVRRRPAVTRGDGLVGLLVPGGLLGRGGGGRGGGGRSRGAVGPLFGERADVGVSGVALALEDVHRGADEAVAQVLAESALLPVPSGRVEEDVENLVRGPVGVGGPDEGGGGGGDGGGGAGSAVSVAVALEGFVAPARDFLPGSSDIHDPPVLRILCHFAVSIRRRDTYDLGIGSRVLLPITFLGIIANRGKEDFSLLVGRFDRRTLPVAGEVTAERHADDLRITFDGSLDGILGVTGFDRIFILKFRVTDTHGNDLRPWSKPLDAPASTCTGNQLSHVGAVPRIVVVLIAGSPGGIKSFEDLTLQRRSIRVDSRVDDSNFDAFAGRGLPHFLGLHRAEVPLLGLHVRRCGRLCHTGKDDAPRSSHRQCADSTRAHTVLGPAHSCCHPDFRTFPGTATRPPAARLRAVGPPMFLRLPSGSPDESTLCSPRPYGRISADRQDHGRGLRHQR